jgi:hypothetical protein
MVHFLRCQRLLNASGCSILLLAYRLDLVAGKCGQDFAGIVPKRSVPDPGIGDSPGLAHIQHAALRELGAKGLVHHRNECLDGE